jgi:hypothetical protein
VHGFLYLKPVEKERKKTEMRQSLTLVKEYISTHKHLLAMWRTSEEEERDHLSYLIESAEQAWHREMARLKKVASEVYE